MATHFCTANPCPCHSTSAPLGFAWNGPLQIRPGGGYEPAPVQTAGTLHDLDDVLTEFDIDLGAKRTLHITIPHEATDAEAERFEECVVDAAYGFKFDKPCDAFAVSHAGDCDDDPHCGGQNPWRQRALAAEQRLHALGKA